MATNLPVDPGWATGGDISPFVQGRLDSGWTWGPDGSLEMGRGTGPGYESDPTGFGLQQAFAKLANGNAATIQKDNQLTDTGQKWYEGDYGPGGGSVFGRAFQDLSAIGLHGLKAYGLAAGAGNAMDWLGSSGSIPGVTQSSLYGDAGAESFLSAPVDSTTGIPNWAVNPYGGAGAESFLEAPINPQTGVPKWAEGVPTPGYNGSSGQPGSTGQPVTIDNATGSIISPNSLMSNIGTGVADPYAGSLTGQAADLMTAYGGNPANSFGSGDTLMDMLRRLKGDPAWGMLKGVGTAANIGTGIYGLLQSSKLAKAGEAAANRADPWGGSGGRGVADAQLQAVLRGGSTAYENTPAYAARMQAVQRQMASQGYNGSGNAAVAAAQAGGAGYNEWVQQMAGLAGANANPASAAAVQAGYAGNSANLAINSLGLLGKTAASSSWFA